jgi:hypothetical protein
MCARAAICLPGVRINGDKFSKIFYHMTIHKYILLHLVVGMQFEDIRCILGVH